VRLQSEIELQIVLLSGQQDDLRKRIIGAVESGDAEAVLKMQIQSYAICYMIGALMWMLGDGHQPSEMFSGDWTEFFAALYAVNENVFTRQIGRSSS